MHGREDRMGLGGGGSPKRAGDWWRPQREVRHRCSSSSEQRRRAFRAEKLGGAALKAGVALVEVGATSKGVVTVEGKTRVPAGGGENGESGEIAAPEGLRLDPELREGVERLPERSIGQELT